MEIGCFPLVGMFILSGWFQWNDDSWIDAIIEELEEILCFYYMLDCLLINVVFHILLFGLRDHPNK